MSDTQEPPAKRVRLETADGQHVPDFMDALDGVAAPGSPVDDMDDDFYEDEPTPQIPAPLSIDSDSGSLPAKSQVAASSTASASSLQLPGLGLLSTSLTPDPTVKQPPQINSNEQPGPAAEPSESVSLYVEEIKTKPADTPAVAATATATASATATIIAEQLPAADVGAATTPTPAVDGAAPPASLITENGTDDATTNAGPSDETEMSKAEFLLAGAANKGNTEAEWELDSQASSSSDSSSDDSDDSSDEEDSDDGELLDPEEAVRRLMMESMDEPGASGPAVVRTLNEVAEVFEKPDITVTETTKITDLGKVDSIVDNMILIKANTSGNFRVLESGSALCLANRTVIGQVTETIGRVQEPMYVVGFSDPAEIKTLGIEKESTVYYVDEHSTFVSTEELKAQKHTDASNLHDEEANDAEFSDDEKEAEFKRKQKDAKKARAEAKRGPETQEPVAQPSHNNDVPIVSQPDQYQGGGLNYGSDEDDDLGMYKPLARPDRFEQIVGNGAPIEDRSHVRRGNMRGRGGWPDRGRGFRGRGGPGGGGGRGAQGGGRGNQRGGQRGGQFSAPTGPSDRGGRHQENNRGRNGPHNEARAASSASPARQTRGQGQQQRSPSRGGGKLSNRQQKQQDRQARHAQSPAASVAPSISPATVSANAYAQNTALNNTPWPMANISATPQPQQSYGYSAPTQPAIPAGAHVNPAFYAPAASTPPVNQQHQQQQQQQQQNLAQWAQWFQLAASMQANQNQGQPQPQPQPHQPQQYQAQANPAPNVNPQANAPQNGTPSLQDILRTLGGGGGAQNR